MPDGYLEITPALSLPLAELDYRATRSGGPGGQHVNTSSTRIEVWWNVRSSPSLAEEVTQEVFVRTFFALDRIDPERPLGSWLCKTAVNVALNIVRKQKFRSQFVESLGPEGAAEWP